METRNLDWKIAPSPDGSLPAEQVTHALLIDIREAVRSIRKMLMFFHRTRCHVRRGRTCLGFDRRGPLKDIPNLQAHLKRLLKSVT